MRVRRSDLKWQDRAECLDGEEDFYPVDFSNQSELKAICNRCSVRPECLDWAIKHEAYGFWGGTNQRERVRLRKMLGVKIQLPKFFKPEEATQDDDGEEAG